MKKDTLTQTMQNKNSRQIEKTYLIQGMDCPNCALTIEKGLENLEGVLSAQVTFSTQKLKISGNIQEHAVLERVRELGYEISEEKPAYAQEKQKSNRSFLKYILQRWDARLFLVGLFLILPGLILEEVMGKSHFVVDLCSIGALAAAGYPVFRSAIRSLRFTREININVLMSIAALGAVFIGAYTEAGMVMVLFLLGEIIEGYTGERTRDAIQSLIELVPQKAARILRENGHVHTQDVSVEELRVGDHIMIRPGEKIAMDGMVIEGVSTVNQASITGESQPVEKTGGAQVFASSINGEGALIVEVTHLAEDNTINRLVQMVEEAQEKKSSAQRFVDRFAKIYTPIVVAVAAIVAIIPPVFFGQPFLNPGEDTFGWLYRGLALLVVGCPCALVISTPVSIISAISNAARRGVLVKGGVFLEELSRIRAFAFDKTGTLTEGKPAVISMRSADCVAPEEMAQLQEMDAGSIMNHLSRCESCFELVSVAGAVETYSEHPLAGAIVSFWRQYLQPKDMQVENVKAVVGRGVVGYIDGSEVTIGSHRYFDENYAHLQQDCESARMDAVNGLTPLMVQKAERFLGTITLGDVVRPTANTAIRNLKEAGMDSLIMLTGDETAVAKGIALDLGIDEFQAQLLPEEKVSAVQDLQSRYGKIAMVGDGINDAPALATADIGIAMSTALGGTAQAMETGDITLMSSNLARLGFLVRLSKATMRRVQFNVFFAILIKVIFFVLVILGWGTMWMAVFADMGTTLFVTLNGMRLLRHPTAERNPRFGNAVSQHQLENGTV